ncbi:hypothetical protein BH10ACT3_BH10ACT3_14830 [soil metagenome]
MSTSGQSDSDAAATDSGPGLSTSTTHGARDHARAMGSTSVEAMPTLPATSATQVPDGVDAADIVWAETIDGGGVASKLLARGSRLRIDDLYGDGCVGILVHNAEQTSERLNIADTVKVQWQAYPGAGSLLLSEMGRVMMAMVADTSGRHDAFCGTTTLAGNLARYGDGALDGPFPNGRDHFSVELTKRGLSRRDVAPNLNLFKGVRIAADGTIEFTPGSGEPTFV